MRNAPRKRRGRVLLAASGVLSTLTGCPGDFFGNLKAPNCDMNPTFCEEPPDLAKIDLQVDAPYGNLKAPVDLAEPQGD